MSHRDPSVHHAVAGVGQKDTEPIQSVTLDLLPRAGLPSNEECAPGCCGRRIGEKQCEEPARRIFHIRASSFRGLRRCDDHLEEMRSALRRFLPSEDWYESDLARKDMGGP